MERAHARGVGMARACPAESVGASGLQRLRDDLPDGELEQLGAGVAVGHARGQQPVELLACPLRGRYSRLHGDASSCRRLQTGVRNWVPSQECIPVPVSLSSNFTTWPRTIMVRLEEAVWRTDAQTRRAGFWSNWKPMLCWHC